MENKNHFTNKNLLMLFGKQQYSKFFWDKYIKLVLETSLKGKYKNIFEILVLGKFLFFSEI